MGADRKTITKARMEKVETWAKYVRDHPRSKWIKEIKPLVDSQIIMANRFYANLAETKEGRQKIKKLRGIDLL